VEIDAVPEGLDDGDNPRLERRPRHCLKIEEKCLDGTAAKIPQEPALELEEHPEHLRDDEDHLTMRNIEKKLLPDPLAPLLKPLGMARRAKPSDMLCTAYPGICGVDEYAECQGVAVGELTAFQGVAVPSGAICFAYSSTSESSDQFVRRTKLAWS
jgi:hypothetical protein